MLKSFFTKQKMFTFLFEVLVIFTGITLSFVFDNWKQNRDSEEKQIFYLQSIHEDLSDDIKELADDIKLYQNCIKALRFYTRYDAKNNPHPDRLMRYYAYIYQSGDVFFNTAGFDALKSTDNMKVLKDRELLKKIIKIYQNDFPRISHWNNQFAETKRVIVLPFFTKREIFSAKGNQFHKLYQEPEFYNILYTLLKYNQVLLENNQAVLENCKKAHQEIGSKLK